jgi:adenylate cyclase class 2
MPYEVEMKFPVAEMAAVEERLAGMGAAISASSIEVDTYFAHPARDFAKTDEALRLRRKDTSHFITYKGPKIDAATKTRREIELPLAVDERGFQAWRSLLEALGFSAVGEVRKRRRKADVAWQDRTVEVSLDEVEPLGTFVELELVALSDGIEAARACILSLARALGLEGGERRSYLELLMERRGA